MTFLLKSAIFPKKDLLTNSNNNNLQALMITKVNIPALSPQIY